MTCPFIVSVCTIRLITHTVLLLPRSYSVLQCFKFVLFSRFQKDGGESGYKKSNEEEEDLTLKKGAFVQVINSFFGSESWTPEYQIHLNIRLSLSEV